MRLLMTMMSPDGDGDSRRFGEVVFWLALMMMTDSRCWCSCFKKIFVMVILMMMMMMMMMIFEDHSDDHE